MTPSITPRAVIATLALATCSVLPSTAGAAQAQSPLSPANYSVSTLCPTPLSGQASCLGLGLVPRSPLAVPGARAVAHGDATPSSPPAAGGGPFVFTNAIKGSLSPTNLRAAYDLAGVPAPERTQTVGIVDAYDDPTAEADLKTYDEHYGLPACTEQNGCFRKVNQQGEAGHLPAWKGTESERGWAQEIATDIEVVRAVCQSCHILLVEASDRYFTSLATAENTAVTLGATEISNSWGGKETGTDEPAFDHHGVVITASSGDSGYRNWLGGPSYVDYPASSPHVVAVGGTRLILNSQGQAWEGESVWNDGGESGGKKEGAGASGGGCSLYFAAPAWQQSLVNWPTVGCASKRAVADVSADGDPYTGVAVYDSTPNENGNTGWAVIGGTSVSSPIIASVFALAGGAHGVEYPARTLYENAGLHTALHDVNSGSNGACHKPFNSGSGTSGCTIAEESESCVAAGSCLAGSGFDGPSGVGSPDGVAAFQPGATSSGGGTTGGGTTGGGTGTGTQGGGSASPISTGSATPVPVATGSGPAAGPVQTPPVISVLALTRTAVIALRRAHPQASRVAVSFDLNAAAIVTATLAKQVRIPSRGSAHRRSVWKSASWRLTLGLSPGLQGVHLGGHGVLAAGRYRLTLAPAAGVAVSISFVVA